MCPQKAVLRYQSTATNQQPRSPQPRVNSQEPSNNPQPKIRSLSTEPAHPPQSFSVRVPQLGNTLSSIAKLERTLMQHCLGSRSRDIAFAWKK